MRIPDFGRGERLALIGVLVLALIGCAGDSTGPTSTLAAQYWSLTLNHHAITLATISPYDTLTLVATPRTFTGDTLMTTGVVTYRSSDTSVIVSPTGQLQAHTTKALTKNVQVIASLTVGGVNGVTLADTALVNIVKQTSPITVPVLDTLSIQLTDSAVTAVGTTKSMTAMVIDTAHHSIPNVQIKYLSSDPLIATYSSTGTVSGIAQAKKVMLYAEATVYGVRKTDSLLFTIGYPIVSPVSIVPSGMDSTELGPRPVFGKHNVVVGVGGLVYWRDQIYGFPDDSVDIVFDDPSAVQGLNKAYQNGFIKVLPSGEGNIPAWVTPIPTPPFRIDSVGTRGRVFNEPGVYIFHSRFTVDSGVITVSPNSEIH